MGLHPLDERATTVLTKEIDNLDRTYRECAEALGPNIGPRAAEALDKINEAKAAIAEELAARRKP